MDTGQIVVIGSYAAADQPGIRALIFDAASGALAELCSLAHIVNPSYVLVHPNGQWLYAVSETDQQQDGVAGAVWALRFGRAPWEIVPINARPSGGDLPCHLAIDASGRWLVVCNYATGSVEVLPIQADGALGAPSQVIQHAGHGPHRERQAGPHAHSTTFTPDGRFALIADLGMDALLVYAFDPAAGQLMFHTRADVHPGAGPRHLAFHPDGRFVYFTNELDTSVVVSEFDPARGILHIRQRIAALPPNAPESLGADVHITQKGDRLYVTNRGHDSVTTFAVAADGRLTSLANFPAGGRWPRHFALSPDERFLLVANQYSDEVVVLPISDPTSAAGVPVTRIAVPGVSCVQFAPDQEGTIPASSRSSGMG